MKKYDIVKLVNKCDAQSLNVGDTGQIMSDLFDDGYFAVAFNEEFPDYHDCEGLVKKGYGWFVKIEDLEEVIK